MAEIDINEDLWETTNQQPVTQQTKERKWQRIVHMPRKLNVAIENLALDWNPQGVRRHGCPRNSKRTVKEVANESGKTWSEIKGAGQQQKRMETFYSFPMFCYKEGQELMMN
jgi:hypothetical protein